MVLGRGRCGAQHVMRLGPGGKTAVKRLGTDLHCAWWRNLSSAVCAPLTTGGGSEW